MRRAAWALLLGALALTGCAGTGGGFIQGPAHPLGSSGAGGASNGAAHKVALLLPLSGPDAGLGQAMRQAAELALAVPGAPSLTVADSAGGNAAQAAREAISAGGEIILGPLTAAETRAVAGPARSADVPVLAFTSDPSVAQPGLWPLGLSPLQQVRRLVAAARAEGRSRFVALLPDNGLGHAMAAALEKSAAEAGLATPTIRFHGAGMAAMTALVREVSDYADRRGPIDKQIREARDKGDRKTAAELARQPIPPPPFDALLLADTGEQLAEITSLLAYYDVDPPQVRLRRRLPGEIRCRPPLARRSCLRRRVAGPGGRGGGRFSRRRAHPARGIPRRRRVAGIGSRWLGASRPRGVQNQRRDCLAGAAARR
jgi:branched-chain amino acid transport system substrate-binding protein